MKDILVGVNTIKARLFDEFLEKYESGCFKNDSAGMSLYIESLIDFVQILEDYEVDAE